MEPPNSKIMDGLKQYYQTTVLNQQNMQKQDMTYNYNPAIIQDFLTDTYTNNNSNILNEDKLILDLQKKNSSLDPSIIRQFINEIIYKNTTTDKNITELYNYILQQF